MTAVLAQLEQQPVDLPLTHPRTGRPVALTRSMMVQGLHGLLYDTPNAVMVPHLVHQMYQGKFDEIAQAVAPNFAADPSAAEWQIMNLTILCHEDWAKMGREETTRLSAGSYMGYEDVRRFTVPESSLCADPSPAAGGALPAGDHVARARPDHQRPGRSRQPAGECRLRKRPLPEQPCARGSRAGSRLYGFRLPGSDPGCFHRKRNDARLERRLPAARAFTCVSLSWNRPEYPSLARFSAEFQ